jgi:single-strand DNA-binding protein
MAAYERIIIVGNLGGEPEIRMVGEKQVANFNVAVNRKRGDTQTTTWYRCAAWNGTAELVQKYLHKGSRVMVEGSSLRVSPYLDQAGKPQASLELTADRVVFLDSKPEEAKNAVADDPEIPF